MVFFINRGYNMIITGRRNTYVNYNIDTVHLQADYNSDTLQGALIIHITGHYNTDTLHLQGALIHKGLYISYYSPFTFYRYIFLQYNTIHYITGRLIHTAIYTGTTYIFFTIQIHYITLHLTYTYQRYSQFLANLTQILHFSFFLA